MDSQANVTIQIDMPLVAKVSAALAEKILVTAGMILVRDLKEILSLNNHTGSVTLPTGRARSFARKNPGEHNPHAHVASAPGEPPALDTGRLRASVHNKLSKQPGGMPMMTVGQNPNKNIKGRMANYGDYLEFGTSKMEARPWVQPVATRYAGSDNLLRKVQQHLGKTGILDQLGGWDIPSAGGSEGVGNGES